MYIQCIYKAQKTGKKTNRCQKINVQKLFNIWLQSGINLITYLLYPKRLINKSINKIKARGRGTHIPQTEKQKH